MLRARALAKVNKLASQTSEFVAPRLELAKESAAGKLANLREAYYAQQQQGNGASAGGHTESNWETSERVVAAPKKALRTKQVQGEFAEPSLASGRLRSREMTPPGTPTESRTGRWAAGIGSYFSTHAPPPATASSSGTRMPAKGKGRALLTDDVDEERIVCFSGWATLQPAPHDVAEPALVLDILRIFYALAKSFAALPKIPPNLASSDTPEAALGSAGSLDSSLRCVAIDDPSVIDKLLEVGGRSDDRDAKDELAGAAVEAVEGKELTDEPSEMSVEEKMRSPTATHFEHTAAHPVPPHHAHHPAHASTAPLPASRSLEDEKIVPTPAKLNRRPHVRIEIPPTKLGGPANAISALRTPSAPSSPSSATLPPKSPGFRSATFGFSKKDRDSKHSRASSAASSVASSRASSRANSPTRASSSSAPPPETWPQPFTLPSSPADLPRLHTNLHTRLLPFFGQKLPARKVRISIYPALKGGQLWDGALATKVVSTVAPGGGFRTRLSVGGKELKKWLEVVGSAPHSAGGEGGLDQLEVRVVAELLEPDGGVSTADSWTDAGAAASVGGGGGYAQAKPTAEDEVELGVAIQGEGGAGGGVRVVSDVDDTIKWTEVLKGTKTIFRNVFVRELYEIRVPGMASWYKQMQTLGCHFHYVSNSPWELWPVVRSFLVMAGFPGGSCTLKEYGGASSALAKLWEEPGQRKRANVEAILKEFPESQFLLIGDSGEQDLELYRSLAAQYPQNVLAIFIRDVTTPFTPQRSESAVSYAPYKSARRADTLTTPVADPASTETLAPPKLRWRHSQSASDLARLVDEEKARFSADLGAEDRPFSEMPDLPGQWDGSHERLVPVRKTSGSEVTLRTSEREPSTPTRPQMGSRTRSSPFNVFRSPGSSRASSPSRASAPSSAPSTPRSELADPLALTDDPFSDALSPNNPLRPSPPPTRPEQGTPASVEAFYKRVADAERGLPVGIKLRLFRHGAECTEEAIKLIKEARERR
ncbi:actin patch protein [Rhodotorula toruloides]|uniref:Actin patch protein n=1 Tax=Rhodotorula toruloides TaxID=5286 RepID=A0A511KF26_RHOTO|nr:actin patch protein [Rhodotorula toruloides]